jgi:hypothetical protein
VKRFIAIACTLASVAIAAETCGHYLVRVPYYAHRVSKQRQAEIARWNKVHPAWADEWKRKHLYAEIDMLCDTPAPSSTSDIPDMPPSTPAAAPLDTEPSPDLPLLSPEEPPQFPSTSDSGDSFTVYQIPYAPIVTNGAYMPTAPTPEPASLAMTGFGLILLARFIKR